MFLLTVSCEVLCEAVASFKSAVFMFSHPFLLFSSLQTQFDAYFKDNGTDETGREHAFLSASRFLSNCQKLITSAGSFQCFLHSNLLGKDCFAIEYMYSLELLLLLVLLHFQCVFMCPTKPFLT